MGLAVTQEALLGRRPDSIIALWDGALYCLLSAWLALGTAPPSFKASLYGVQEYCPSLVPVQGCGHLLCCAHLPPSWSKGGQWTRNRSQSESGILPIRFST